MPVSGQGAAPYSARFHHDWEPHHACLLNLLCARQRPGQTPRDQLPAVLQFPPCGQRGTSAAAARRPADRRQAATLQHCGIQFRGFDTPCYEDMPRYEGPGAESLFYYRQEDDLMAVQQRTRRWHYNIIRPFGIVGFTNQFSGINEALCIAQYFLICRHLGQPPKWPGSYNGWHLVEGQSYAPSLADLHLWAASHEETRDQAFNHGNGNAIAWRFLWAMFGGALMRSEDGRNLGQSRAEQTVLS
ncbi:hypothetical protein BDW74DRAFT_171952 [Aspergillus multicolor]|uniref:uncharacterized protein n=1 Tax=Aspergillus multicolor TaxID=41759 RepID=UPI003CCD4766